MLSLRQLEVISLLEVVEPLEISYLLILQNSSCLYKKRFEGFLKAVLESSIVFLGVSLGASCFILSRSASGFGMSSSWLLTTFYSKMSNSVWLLADSSASFSSSSSMKIGFWFASL